MNGHSGMSVELLDRIADALNMRWMLGSERDNPRDRVLMFMLLIDSENSLSGREVARQLGMPVMTTSNYLHALKLTGTVHCRRAGRSVLWWGATT
jgi:biotin operon repressor